MAPKIEKKIEPIEGRVIKVWTAPSSSEFGTKHFTLAIALPATANDIREEITFTCSCKGMQYSGTCWHTDEAREQLP